MLARDLAELYGVETKQLKRAVSRNKERLPDDFIFVLINQEVRNLRGQLGTSRWGGSRYLPMAFTKLRKMLLTHEDLRQKIEAMEDKYDEQSHIVFQAIKQLLQEDDQPKRKIGY